LNQSFKDFEIIISDNCSSDETEDICHSYLKLDSRIRYIRQKENYGVSHNFNYVLQESVGEFFMWAAHDDLWDRKYLEFAVNIMDEKSPGFVFPTFKIESIDYKIKKHISKDIFSFIENQVSNLRVINFANLHHSSLKCNIAYSFYKIDLIKEVYTIQDIVNDGILCMVLLGKSSGCIMDGNLFSKRYKKKWPGFDDIIAYFLPKKSKDEFYTIRDSSFLTMEKLFPDLKDPLEKIRKFYKPHNLRSNYKILKNSEITFTKL
jgi:glycosyltransferase involved in cell wall biosynthesis